jgi:hypothetical protein
MVRARRKRITVSRESWKRALPLWKEKSRQGEVAARVKIAWEAGNTGGKTSGDDRTELCRPATRLTIGANPSLQRWVQLLLPSARVCPPLPSHPSQEATDRWRVVARAKAQRISPAGHQRRTRGAALLPQRTRLVEAPRDPDRRTLEPITTGFTQRRAGGLEPGGSSRSGGRRLLPL